MKKKALYKDIIRTIRRTLPRFLSIFFIVALGVAFYSGIRVTEKDMKITADRQFDDSEFMDLEIIGTLGLSDRDLEAVKQLSGVVKAEGSYSVDTICQKEGEQDEYVTKVMAATDELNQITVTEGKMPSAQDECLVDEIFARENGFEIGDTLVLSSGTDTTLSDTLKKNSYKITGIGKSPAYLSMERGSSEIGSGSVSGFLVVPKEAFCLDVYTEIYITADDAADELAYTDAYNDTVKKTQDQLEGIQDQRNDERLQEIQDEANEEIAKQEKTFQKEKDKALQELSDAEKQLEDAKKQIDDSEKTLSDSRKEIEDGEEEIEKGWEEYNNGLKQINDAKEEIEKGRTTLEDEEKKLSSSESQITQQESNLKKSEQQIQKKESELDQSEQQIDKQEKELDQLEEQITAYEKLPDADQDTLNNMKQQLSDGRTAVSRARQQIASGREEITAAQKQVTDGRTKLNAAKKQLSDGREELNAAKKQLSDSEAEISRQEKSLASAKQTLQQNEQKIAQGKQQLESGEKQLEEAKEEYRKGLKEYQDSEKKAMEELADGEKKIQDAKDEVSSMEKGSWYVLNRQQTQSYVEYGEEAARIGAIGTVFPAIFFLVAALVSLTAMTRMVEEQRTQIGTMKALGYTGRDIASKYLIYGMAATVTGSVIGAVVGEKVLPKIIIEAYKMMYAGLGTVQVPLEAEYTLMASGIAVGVVILATISVCYKELREKPAQLMRPAAPKEGKRIFLERLSFVWKRLSFIWKATMRNMFRYKKRFFMMIFGIGGSMALMLVGFGVKDSISAISDNQFQRIIQYDISIGLKEGAGEQEKEKLLRWLSEKDGITETKEVREMTVDLEANGKTRSASFIVPLDQDGFDQYVALQDRITGEKEKLGTDGVILAEKTATLLDVEPGDEITIGEGEDDAVTVKVAGLTENYMMNKVYMSPELYQKLYGRAPEATNIYCCTDNVSKEWENTAGTQILSQEGAGSVSFVSDDAQSMQDMVANLNIVVVVLIVSAGLLAFVVLYNLNNINISERRAELATIKVLGFYDKEVGEYVYRENVILTILGIIAGIGLGIVLHRYVIMTAEVDLIMFGRSIYTASYIYSILLTIGFAIMINFLMFFQLKKIDMVESLKSTE